MLRYQPRLLRLRETAVAVLTCTPIVMDWILAAPVLLTQNSRCYSIQTMGTSQRPSRAHSACAKWPLPACNVWQRPRAVAWLAQGQTNFARCAATGPSLQEGSLLSISNEKERTFPLEGRRNFSSRRMVS